MAAAGLVELMGGTVVMAVDAASMALQKCHGYDM
jgi:L-serine deaminase